MPQGRNARKGCSDLTAGHPATTARPGCPPSPRASLQDAARELHQPAAAIRVQIRPLKTFWPAEGYHQNYAELNALRYRYYRWACGRDRRLDAVWGARARRGQPWAG